MEYWYVHEHHQLAFILLVLLVFQILWSEKCYKYRLLIQFAVEHFGLVLQLDIVFQGADCAHGKT